MFLSTQLNKNHFNVPKVKIRHGSQIQKSNNQKDNQLQIQTLNGKQKDSERLKSQLSPRQIKQISKKVQKSQLSISFQDLKLKLNQVIYKQLDRQYEGSFSQKSQYSHLIDKLKDLNTFEELISCYTQTLISIVKLMKEDHIRLQPKFRTVVLNTQQRTKLKLILSDSQEKQLNQFKSKGIESYVQKIEDQCQKHKREYMKVKQRNRIIQSQMLKISLQFKNKRQLYITEIARLTEILHSSFLEIGKMFVNTPISNYQRQNQRNFQHQPLNNSLYDRNYQRNNLTNQQSQPNLNKKNVKSLSPKRQIQNYYSGKNPKLFDFIPESKNYQNQSKKSQKYQDLRKYDQNYNKNSLDTFQSGKQRNFNVSRNQFGIKSNLGGIKKNSDHFKVS